MIEQILGGLANTIFNGFGNFVNDRQRQENVSQVNEQNYRMQKEFAQNSLSWKIKDGLKNGIHPLASIGASTYQATPSFVGDSSAGSGTGNTFKHIGGTLKLLLDNKNEEDKLNLKKLNAEITHQELENLKLKREVSGDVFGQYKGSASVGVPNDAFSSFDSAIPLNKIIGTDLDMSINPVGVDGEWELTMNPDSFRGQAATESAWKDLIYNLDNRFRLSRGLSKRLEEGMKRAGLLKNNERLESYYYGLGVKLKAVPKSLPSSDKIWNYLFSPPPVFSGRK